MMSRGDSRRTLGRDQQMDMVGHQCLSMERAGILLQRFTQPVEIGLVVFFGKETGLAVVAALDDVKRNAIKMDAGAAGHG